MASITELEPGKHYRVRVSCGKNADGKYIPWSEYVIGTKTEAKKRAAEMEATKDRRQAPAPQTITLAEWYTQVRARMAVDHSPTTMENMQWHWRRLNTLLGNAPLHEITRARVQAAMDALATAPFIADKDDASPRRLSAATVAKHKTLLCYLMNEAVSRGLIPVNPVQRITLPRKQATPIHYPTRDEIAQLQRALDNEVLSSRVCVSLMLYTGVSRGELIGLRWGDISLVETPAGTLTQVRVSRAAKRKDGVQIVAATKTTQRRRVIGAPAALWTLLQEWRAAFVTCDPDDYILRWPPNGKWWHLDQPSRVFPAVIKRAGLRHLRGHDARHTYASLLIAAGLDIAQIQAILGHSTPHTTLTIYTHLLTPASQATADAITTAFGLSFCPNSQKTPETEANQLPPHSP